VRERVRAANEGSLAVCVQVRVLKGEVEWSYARATGVFVEGLFSLRAFSVERGKEEERGLWGRGGRAPSAAPTPDAC
jgi:hypothetical protein